MLCRMMDPLATLSRHRIRNVKWTARAKRDVLFVHATQSLVEEVLSFGVVVALSWQFEEVLAFSAYRGMCTLFEQ